MSLALDELARSIGATAVDGDAAVVVRDLRHDSRLVEPGDLFVALRGENADGTKFVDAALARGAVAVLSDVAISTRVPVVRVDDARRAFGPAAEWIHGRPSHAIPFVAVTGTNGKTTTTWIVDEALRAAGAAPCLVGTVELRGPGGFRETAAFTTPEADVLARFARSMIDRGATHLVMEASSHALAQHRTDASRIDVAVFTNLTQDHLDFHRTMDAYFEAKARLFLELAPRVSVIRIDDAWGARLAKRVDAQLRAEASHRQLLTVSRDPASTASLRPVAWESTRGGITGRITTPWGELALSTRLVGAHNLDNVLFAVATLGSLGIPLDVIAVALGRVQGAPGRLERVDAPNDVSVLVDYAHTPDALDNALSALRPLTPGRLLVVFGCGGDRDRTKRPRMGEAAARGADLVVITSDNPRTEAPEAIVDEIVPGVVPHVPAVEQANLATAARGYVVEVDRRSAITLAIAAARPGDTVLIAGKGHEDYQILGREKIHFDDREEARAALAALAEGAR